MALDQLDWTMWSSCRHILNKYTFLLITHDGYFTWYLKLMELGQAGRHGHLAVLHVDMVQ